jgi:hypothetical protein
MTVAETAFAGLVAVVVVVVHALVDGVVDEYVEVEMTAPFASNQRIATPTAAVPVAFLALAVIEYDVDGLTGMDCPHITDATDVDVGSMRRLKSPWSAVGAVFTTVSASTLASSCQSAIPDSKEQLSQESWLLLSVIVARTFS